MRKVVTSQEVTHLWAHKRQPEARNGKSSLYFDGDTIYSYGSHFPIARHLENGAIAFTTDSYRQTTAGHMSLVRRAIPRSKTLIFVHNPCMTAGRRDREIVEGAAIRHLASAAKRRSERLRLDDMGDAVSVVEEFNAYAEAIGSAERIDVDLYRAADMVVLQQRMAERAAAEEESRRLAEIETGKRLAGAVEEWRNHGAVASWEIRNAPVALRIQQCGGGTHYTGGLLPDRGSEGKPEIQTSRGATIPVDDAKRLWPMIQRCMTGERDYEVGMDLGGYQLTKIRRDGSIVVGCHDIAFAEIERIAKALDLVPSEAPA